MSGLYARCDSCKRVFEAPDIFGGNAAELNLAGNTVEPCPLCGRGPGRILDGTYNLENNVMLLIDGPQSSWDALKELAQVVKTSIEAGESAEKTIERAQAIWPGLAKYKNALANAAITGLTWLVMEVASVKLAQELTPNPVTLEQTTALIKESERRILGAVEALKPSPPPTDPGRISL